MAILKLKDLGEFKTMVGKELPIGEWVSVSQEMINNFADATLDHQWIHVDVARANAYSPFKKPIAHGFMSVSLLSKMLGDLISIKSVKMGVNYGLNKVRFPSPVPVDSKLRLTGKVTAIEEYSDNGVKITWDCTVELEHSDKPACVAQFISLMFE